MVDREPFRDAAVVEESLVEQPFEGSTLGSDITQGMPGGDQFAVVFIDLALESSERSSPLQRLGQASAGRVVGDPVSKVGHVLKPRVGRENCGAFGPWRKGLRVNRPMRSAGHNCWAKPTM